MANRNRTAGNNYERKIVNELKEKGYDCVTSRSESRNMDALGIDVFGDTGNVLLHDIQCKVKQSISKSEIQDLLSKGRDTKDLVIFHKHVKKSGVRFMPQGEYVYMKKDTYYDMLHQLLVLTELIEQD